MGTKGRAVEFYTTLLEISGHSFPEIVVTVLVTGGTAQLP
jgi:hypothetical protein